MRNRFKLLAVAALLLAGGVYTTVSACTNFIVTKGASRDGSTMITYAADSHTLYGELYYRPAMDYPEGAMMDIYEWDTGKYLGKIKQVRHTYAVIGNMNEHQLAIGETTYTGREELQDTTGIIDYGSLIYLTLQRAKTAREAVQIMGQLVAEYGYYSTGESMSISDPNEAWIFEIIGKGSPVYDKNGKIDKKKYSRGAVWVARRIPDGYISGHANHARITDVPLKDPNTLYAKDVIEFARKKGYFKGKDEEFSFSDTYAPLDFSGARFSEARVWAGFNMLCDGMDKYLDYAMGKNLKNRMPLWVKPRNPISAQDLMHVMRDHYDGTPMDMTKDLGAGPFSLPYRWRPLTWKVDGHTYFNERAIATQQTGFSFIAQSRSWLPDPVGGIFWFGVDDAASTVYVPMYCGMKSLPENYRQGNGSMLEYSPTAAFWVFTQVSNFAYTRYSDIMVDVKKVQSDLENGFVMSTAAIDKQAAELYKANPEKAIRMITDYSVQQGSMTFNRWKQLYEYLLVKYHDGNIKKEKDGKFMKNGYTQPAYPDQPGYPEWWLKKIAEDSGDKLKYQGEASH